MNGEVRRRVVIVTVTGGLLLLSAVSLCAYFMITPRRSADIMVDCSGVAPYLKDGDVICRMGDRVWSAFIGSMSRDERRFSHLGVVRIRDGGITVINAECLTRGRSESVNETPLADFLALAKSVGVYRANFIDGAVISDKAMEYLGRPFDWDFDISDESKIYCTELLYLIIKHIAPERCLKTVQTHKGGKPIVLLESVSNSSDFDEILYE